MIKIRKLGLLSLFLVTFMIISSVGAQSLSGELLVKGSSTVYPVMEEAQSRWQTLHPDVQISVASIGSGGGFQALLDEQTDIAPMSRPPTDAEYQAAADAGFDITKDTTIRIGLDAMAILVNPANPVTAINRTTLRAIYQGNYTKWSEAFPGKDFSSLSSDNIYLLERDQNSGTHDYFDEEILTGTPANKSAYGSNYGQFNAQADLNTAVASLDNSIGYSGLAYVDSTVKAIKFSPDDLTKAIEPSKEVAADGSYALARPLFLVYDASKSNVVRDAFLDYIKSPEGQYIVGKVGYVPVYEAASSYTDTQAAPFPFISVFATITFIGIAIRYRRY